MSHQGRHARRARKQQRRAEQLRRQHHTQELMTSMLAFNSARGVTAQRGKVSSAGRHCACAAAFFGALKQQRTLKNNDTVKVAKPPPHTACVTVDK